MTPRAVPIPARRASSSQWIRRAGSARPEKKRIPSASKRPRARCASAVPVGRVMNPPCPSTRWGLGKSVDVAASFPTARAHLVSPRAAVEMSP